MAFVNLNKDGYPFVTGVGSVTQDSASLDLIAEATHNLYTYVERISYTVYKAAEGGSGVLEIKDTEGEIFWTIPVDKIHNDVIDFGDEGVKASTVKNVGFQAVLSGAETQASVNIGMGVHYR